MSSPKNESLRRIENRLNELGLHDDNLVQELGSAYQEASSRNSEARQKLQMALDEQNQKKLQVEQLLVDA